MQLAVVVLGTLVGLLAWALTVTWCLRAMAEERAALWREVAFINGRRVRSLERARAVAHRWLGALRDLVTER